MNKKTEQFLKSWMERSKKEKAQQVGVAAGFGTAAAGVAYLCGAGPVVDAVSFVAGAVVGAAAYERGKKVLKARKAVADMFAALTEEVKEVVEEEEGPAPALDSNLNPVNNRCTPWDIPEQEKDEFLRQHGTDVLR